jgi:hypothetical protein
MGLVICKLPRAGLGNQLFPLLKAYTFANLNNLPVLVVNYHQIKIGPWLRGERNKRVYSGFFNFEKNNISALFDKWKVKNISTELIIPEPEIKQLENSEDFTKYFLFHEIPHYSKRFEGLTNDRGLVINQLNNIIRPSIKKRLEELKPPCIGVHIRMADFKKIKEGEEFGREGATRTPEDYFVKTIQSIRNTYGDNLPVSIFTDGSKKEFCSLLQQPKIHFIEGNNDLVDLLLLSKSDIIITSGGSTFSYWAAFLSDGIVIMHPSFNNIKIRPEGLNTQYEGVFDKNNLRLKEAIQAIKIKK